MLSTSLTALSLLSLASAHFTLDWPPARGFDDDKAVNFPCGGFDSVSSNRTSWPLGGPVRLNMHHTQTNVEVLLALGSDPGNNYNIVLKPTLTEQGLGNFCIGSTNIPSGLNISDGTQATIQVVSNGDPSGGLYQCADVTISTTPLSAADFKTDCSNGTGIQVSAQNLQGNPNETTTSASASSSGSAASATASKGAAAQQTMGAFILGAVGFAGMALL